MLIPHNKTKNGVVIEIKSIEASAKTNKINQTIKDALNQINNNKYYKELIDNKIHEDKIIKVPIIFAGKEPFITEII